MNDNKGLSYVLIAVAVALCLAASAIGGCSLGDIVKSDVPPTVHVDGLPANPSHNESLAAFSVWAATVEAERKQWASNLERSGELIGAVSAFGNTAIEQFAPSLAGLPFGGLAIGALSLAAGIFMPKPGTQKVVDAAYDAGRNDALKDFSKGAVAVSSASS